MHVANRLAIVLNTCCFIASRIGCIELPFWLDLNFYLFFQVMRFEILQIEWNRFFDFKISATSSWVLDLYCTYLNLVLRFVKKTGTEVTLDLLNTRSTNPVGSNDKIAGVPCRATSDLHKNNVISLAKSLPNKRSTVCLMFLPPMAPR